MQVSFAVKKRSVSLVLTSIRPDLPAQPTLPAFPSSALSLLCTIAGGANAQNLLQLCHSPCTYTLKPISCCFQCSAPCVFVCLFVAVNVSVQQNSLEPCSKAQMMCVAASREERRTGESWPSTVMMQLLSLPLSLCHSLSVRACVCVSLS